MFTNQAIVLSINY